MDNLSSRKSKEGCDMQMSTAGRWSHLDPGGASPVLCTDPGGAGPTLDPGGVAPSMDPGVI